MNVITLFADDEAVSPVIGVILMVAITVILAAVIGAFVLGFGGGGPAAPSVQWDASESTSGGTTTVTFAHGGGDTINAPNDVLSATGDVSGSLSFTGASDGLQTGDTAAIDTDGSTPATVTLVWESPDSDTTQELASHTVN